MISSSTGFVSENHCFVDPASSPPNASGIFRPDEILRQHSRTFWWATRLLPPSVRPKVVTLYAFYRTLDQLADDRSVPIEQAPVELRAWRRWVLTDFQSAPPNPLLGAAVTRVFREHAIPRQYTIDLIDGLLSDLSPRCIESRAELLHYCYQVGGTVGLTLAPLLGVTCQRGLMAARDLGIAMQLTNVLRDVAEDLRHDRVYLPREDLERFDLSADDLHRWIVERRSPPEQLRALIRLYIALARQYYQRATLGYPCLRPDCAFAIRAASALYSAILTVIERNHYDVLRQRAATTSIDKLFILLHIYRQSYRFAGGEACRCRE